MGLEALLVLAGWHLHSRHSVPIRSSEAALASSAGSGRLRFVSCNHLGSSGEETLNPERDYVSLDDPYR